MESNEENLLNIIVNSGEAKSLAFEAIQMAKLGEMEDAKGKLEEAKKVQIKAHNAQTELLVKEVNGEQTPFSILLVHAQDHLMNSITFVDLAKEIVELYDDIRVKRSCASCLHEKT